MNAIYEIMTLDIWQSVLWTLAHSLWQGMLIASLLYLLLKWVPVRRTQLRYGLALTALIVVVLGTLTTWSIQRLPEAPAVPTEAASDVNAKYAVVTTVAPEPIQETPARPAQGLKQLWAAYVVLFWVLGVLAMLMRVAFSLGAAQGLAQGGRVLEDPKLMQCIESLQGRLHLRCRLLVKVVHTLDVPAVIGFIRPTLLLPLAFLNEMSLAQVEVVLAHELAHIRRRDVLFALLQRMIEALLFFNPAVWWISRQISLEREACCDAVAATLTGPPETVAQTLYDVVKHLQRPAPGLCAAMALHQPKHSGHFTERLHRLIEPTAQARLRLPWVSFALLVVLTGIGLTILHWGTNRAVIKAAELLSPQQHVDHIAQTKREYEPPKDANAEGRQGDFLVKGTVRTSDGSPLPDDLRVLARGHYANGTVAYGTKLKGAVFQRTVKQRRVSVFAIAESYAPLVVGPLEFEAEQTVKSIELVLQPGFRAQVRLRDPSGTPIKEAKVDFSYYHGNSTFHSDSLTSDENGLIAFKHAAALPISLSVRMHGYQFDYLKTQLSKDRPLDWTLVPAQPTTGTLVSKATGRPIVDAPIYLLSRQGFQNRVIDAREAYSQKHHCLTRTDAQGRFVLDSLRNDCIYALYIDGTDDYGPDILPGIIAGQQDLRLQVSGPRYVQGRILGAYEPTRRRLNGAEAVPVLQYGNELHFGNSTYSSGFHTQLYPLEDQTGWSFKIPNLLPNDVTISLEGHPYRTIPRITQAIEDYLIDLRPGAPDPSLVEQETRRVVVKLQAPTDWPVPTGKVRVDHVMTDRNAYKPYWLDLKDGQVALDVPMLEHGQGKFRYESSKDLVGYWIEEKSEIPIPPGDTPFVIEVQAHPAGAIHGEVLDWEGRPLDNADVYMYTVQKSPDAKDKRLPLDHSIDVGPDGRFVLTPVPLGGTYQVKAYSSHVNEHALVFSEELTVTRETPTQVVTLKLPAGKTLKGRIVNPDGQGLRHAKVALNYDYKHGGHSGAPIVTDAGGYFQFVHVNTAADCRYSFQVSTSGNYVGCEVPVNGTGIQEIVLQKGLILRGRIIDSKSKGLIPGAELTLYSLESAARNQATIETQTNARGEFVVKGLEAVAYQVRVEGATHPDTKITENPNGTVSYRGRKSITLQGDQPGPVDIYVKLRPGSRLQPLGSTP